MKKMIYILLVMLTCASPIYAQRERRSRNRYPHIERQEGHKYFGVSWRTAEPADYFYLLPTHLGASVFVLAGNVVGTPAKAIYNVCHLDFHGDAYLPPVRFGDRYLSPIGGYLLGSPFWFIKEIIYDGPIALYNAIAGEEKDPEIYEFSDDEKETEFF